jgi:hypothetical protein
VDVGLTTPDLRTVPGERGSSRRPRTTRLARRRVRLRGTGRRRLRVRIGAKPAALLRRHGGVTARLTVQARDGRSVAVSTRTVRVGILPRG